MRPTLRTVREQTGTLDAKWSRTTVHLALVTTPSALIILDSCYEDRDSPYAENSGPEHYINLQCAASTGMQHQIHDRPGGFLQTTTALDPLRATVSSGSSNFHLINTFVSVVILIQLGHFVCVISTLWTMTVSTYGDPSQLSVFPLAADLAIPLSAFTVFIVQSFYAFRLWRLTRNFFLPILCEMLSVIAQTFTLILAARAISMTNFTTFEDSQIRLIALSFIARAVCDCITTAGITWGLKTKRGDIGDTPTIVDLLILWTIETGLVTSLMAVTVATLVLALKQNYVWFGAWLMWPNGNDMEYFKLTILTRVSCSRRELLVSLVSCETVFTDGRLNKLTNAIYRLNRRLLLRETRGASRGNAQSRGGGLVRTV
ncbi:hypothetical protein DFH29DRAFT_1073023 [Suillus ampliporus]|nr:hypothetical protein DFH29DRAFT_1073023 [Suillus ampliporus]